MRETLAEAGVLQGFHYFASEKHEQDGDRDDTENGAGHESAPIGSAAGLLGAEGIYGNRHHLNRSVSADQKGPKEIIPGIHSGQDA